jgi:hypothetical protein
VYPIEDPRELPGVLAVMRGGDGWPPVAGFLCIPATAEELAAWRALPEAAEALSECWILEAQALDGAPMETVY